MKKLFGLPLRKKIFLAGTLIWMIIIFLFSSRVAEKSSKDSSAVIDVIGNIVIQDYEEYTAEEKNQFVSKLELPVRKLAHAAEYLILGILIMGCLVDDKHTIVMYGGISLAVSACYAMTDEFHQLFVDGRSGKIVDVLIDSTGAMVGILLAILVVKKLEKIKEKKNAA